MYKRVMLAAIVMIGEMEGRPVAVAASEKSMMKRIKVTKTYHHASEIQDRIVLYFSAAPDCLYIPSRGVVDNNNQPTINDQGQKELTYFFRVHGMTAKEVHRIISKVKDMHHPDYSLTMTYDHHKEGIKVTIAFNDKKIGFQYESFMAITGEHALSFAFFKRDSLDKIKNKNLFNTAYCKKKI